MVLLFQSFAPLSFGDTLFCLFLLRTLDMKAHNFAVHVYILSPNFSVFSPFDFTLLGVAYYWCQLEHSAV